MTWQIGAWNVRKVLTVPRQQLLLLLLAYIAPQENFQISREQTQVQYAVFVVQTPLVELAPRHVRSVLRIHNHLKGQPRLQAAHAILVTRRQHPAAFVSTQAFLIVRRAPIKKEPKRPETSPAFHVLRGLVQIQLQLEAVTPVSRA